MAILNKRLGKIVVGFIVLVTVVNLFLLSANNGKRNHAVDHLNQLISSKSSGQKASETNAEKKYGLSITIEDISKEDIGAKGVPQLSKTNHTISKVEKYSAENHFKNIIKDNKIILFSKSYCPFSKGLKERLSKFEILPELKVIELDELENGAELQEYVFKETGRKTVPNLIIPASGLKSIGGFDDFKELSDEEIKTKLNFLCSDHCSLTLKA
ncbi:hypothetical protein ACO0OE_000383 [Hanseniaspora uvarum]|uniref:Monothiol glutaredoxin-7 n=1 Tax=Hanseniaspora uvarum TaxID=29833 RepID=A0A1E5R9W6_HANUV|nr:Monothiol glutaredoxin-7 [Hanseniaspora uvarum]